MRHCANQPQIDMRATVRSVCVCASIADCSSELWANSVYLHIWFCMVLLRACIDGVIYLCTAECGRRTIFLQQVNKSTSTVLRAKHTPYIGDDDDHSICKRRCSSFLLSRNARPGQQIAVFFFARKRSQHPHGQTNRLTF